MLSPGEPIKEAKPAGEQVHSVFLVQYLNHEAASAPGGLAMFA